MVGLLPDAVNHEGGGNNINIKVNYDDPQVQMIWFVESGSVPSGLSGTEHDQKHGH